MQARAIAATIILSLVAAGPALAGESKQRYALAVEGMSCSAACPPAVKGALGKIEGVSSVEVDYATKTAVLEVEPGATLDLKACNRALGNSGYFATGLEKLARAPLGEAG